MTAVNTFAAGQLVTATSLNFLLGGASGRKPSFRVHMNGTQSIPNAVTTTVKFDTVDEDTDSAYSTSTGVYTVQTPGLWLFAVASVWATSAVGVRGVEGQHNGGQFLEHWVPASADVASIGRFTASRMTRCVAGDTIWANFYQSSGGALAFGGQINAALEGFWVSA